MDYWLYRLLLSANDDRSPREALQSTINWMRAFAFEVEQEHGTTPKAQYDSCLKIFKGNTQGKGSNIENGVVFEYLYLSLLNSLTVISLSSESDLPPKKPWLIPGMIVNWYYSYYMAMRAILAAGNIHAPETHGGVIKAINNNGVIKKLPHPLNMRAFWIKNEEYAIELPNHLGAKGIKLTGSFEENRQCAQSMLIGYLSGTKAREVGFIKDQIKKDKQLNDFKTQAARALRDTKLEGSQFNFMNCAFRYRGKAQYRDGIYISYGARDISNIDAFMKALSITARFAFSCSLAFVSHRIGVSTTKEFIDDLSVNLRGNSNAEGDENFWHDLVE